MIEMTSSSMRGRMRIGIGIAWILGSGVLTGCGGDRPATDRSSEPHRTPAKSGSAKSDQYHGIGGATGRTIMNFDLTSSAFARGSKIPRRHTGDGEDLSPPLAWSQLPAGTLALALIVDDPDAPTPEPWIHWVLYNLKPDASGLPEGITPVEKPAKPAGVVQGKNSWGGIGYRGPAPPKGHGLHHYRFRLYAIEKALDLKPGLDANALARAIHGHVLGVAELQGTYER